MHFKDLRNIMFESEINMAIQDKSREELIQEFHKLQQSYDSLQSLYKETNLKLAQSERVFEDMIFNNPMSIQIIDKNGLTLQTNPAHTKLFGAIPPPDYCVFNDPQLIKQGLIELINCIKDGKIVHFPDLYYNVQDTYPKLPNVPIWIRIVVFPINDVKGNPEKFVIIHENITESKLKGIALQESEENYRQLLELAPVGFFQTDELGNIIMANKKATIITGYTNEELRSKNLRELFSETAPYNKPLHFDLLDQGKVVFNEQKIKRKENVNIFVEMNSRKMPNNTYQTFMSDISERKKADADLRDSEHLYRTIFENTGSYSIIIEEDTTISLANTEWTNLTGYSHNELEKKMSWTDFIAPIDQDRLQEYHKARRVDPTRVPRKYEFQFIDKNGEIRNMINCVAMIPESKKSIATIWDITELKQAEATLKENEGKLKTIIETSPDGMVITSLSGEIQFITKKTLSIWGYDSQNEIIGENVIKYIHPNYYKKALRFFDKMINGTPTGVEEFLMIRKDGSHFFCESNANILHDAHNTPIGILFVNRDITQRKEVEYELIKAKEKAEESDRLKSAFLANMSHEIRTPMNGILGFADLLKEPQLSGEEQKEYISIIEKSGERMLNIINNIIDISKIESGEVKTSISETNINEQINDILNFFKHEVEQKGLSLILRSTLPSANIIIKTDREMVYAILTNLIKNAIKFTDKGSIELGCGIKKGFLEYYIKDTGVGIPKDRQQAVFERFIQADISDKRAFQGAGLGLAITKAFVEILGGKIWLESEVQKGTIFYFTIPYHLNTQKAATDLILTSETPLPSIKPLKILVAEDDDISEKYITQLLRKYNCEIIHHARTGIEAVNTYLDHPNIDLILMDMKMPEMNGYEATLKIREISSNTIIIAQSAYALSGDKEKAMAAGCNDYLAKPIIQESLNVIMDKYFSE